MAITDTKAGRLTVIVVVAAALLGAFLLYGWYGERMSRQATDRMEDRLRSAYASSSPEHVQELWNDSLADDPERLDDLLGETGQQPIAFGEVAGELRGRWQVESWGVETCVVVSWGEGVKLTRLEGRCPLGFDS